VIVLDTHAWIWWVSDPSQLTARARRAISRAQADTQVHISSISAWEVALLLAKGRLSLTLDLTSWIAKSEALPFLHFVPVDNAIAVSSLRLPGALHADPADRIIVATALALGAPLATADEKLHRYRHVKTIW
jgi:PIN domain nuclease of toxin-antitoxin system